MGDNHPNDTDTTPAGYVGSDDHGPGLSSGDSRRTIASIAWGSVQREVTSEHGQSCDYCGVNWPTGVHMPAHTHPGMDISMNSGTPLFAVEAGTVSFAAFDPRFYRPHHVDIVTAEGIRHIYAHMRTIAPGIVAGSQVTEGQPIGTSGEQTSPDSMTPDGTGGHLHFEARVQSSNKAVDPEPILTRPQRPPVVFQDGAQIKVIDGPLHLRESGNLQAAVLDSLAVGTKLKVTGGPVHHDGFTWYRVDVEGSDKKGWVAGEFCRLVE